MTDLVVSKTSVSQDDINGAVWAACDTFRGTVDPSIYKDYVLTMLFLKYVSDVWQDHYDSYKQQYGDHPELIEEMLKNERFVLPAWIPGSYLIREFARHFVQVRAHDPAGAAAITKLAKSEWQAAPCTGPLTVTAHVYAFDLSVRTAYLDATRGYFNGPAVFLCPVGHEQSPCEVDIVRPQGDAYAVWRVATTLPATCKRACTARRLPANRPRSWASSAMASDALAIFSGS